MVLPLRLVAALGYAAAATATASQLQQQRAAAAAPAAVPARQVYELSLTGP